MNAAWRWAWRAMRHDWRATTVSVALLAVSVGAVMAAFAIVDVVLLQPLPFPDQERIAIIWQRDDRRALPVIEVAYGEMEDWASRSRSFEQLSAVGSVTWSLQVADRPEPVQADLAAVSSSFFPTMGTPPDAGRWLSRDEDSATQPTAMVISHGFWQRHFGGDPSVVGRAIPVRLNADLPPLAVVVVGIMPAAFDYPRGADVYVPAAPLLRTFAGTGADEPARTLSGLRVFYAVGRLRPGVGHARATQELTQVSQSRPVHGGPEPPQLIVLQPIREYLVGPAGPVLRTLLGGSLLMLVIACANVAGAEVSRAARQQRALAIRAALGASPGKLVTQVLIASILFTGVAFAGAVAVGWTFLRALLAFAPADVPRLGTAALLDVRVLGFGILVTLATTAVCALWPVLVVRRVDTLSVLAHGARVASDPRDRWIQRAVVVAQVAIAVALLFGTTLFLRTVRGLDRTVLGFEPDGLLALEVGAQTEDIVRWNVAMADLIARVEALPGVRSAAVALVRPLTGPIGWDNQPIFPGQPLGDPSSWGLNPHLNFVAVSARYFQTMGTRLVRGRFFTEADSTSAPGVAIVSESAAARLWPGQEAIGQRLREPTYRVGAANAPAGAWQTVVGVVQDVRFRGLNDVRLDLYVPVEQSQNRAAHLLVRFEGAEGAVAASVRAAARDIHPLNGAATVVSMRTAVSRESAPWRFLMRVFVAFALLAATLATSGLAAIVTLTGAARRRELAVRAALGAEAARLQALVLHDAVPLIAAGVGLGVLAALALGRGVATALIGIPPHDLVTLASVVAVATAGSLLAAWWPARQAAKADLSLALRAE